MLQSPSEKARDGIGVGGRRAGNVYRGRPWDYVSYYHFLFLLVEDRDCGLKEKGKRF